MAGTKILGSLMNRLLMWTLAVFLLAGSETIRAQPPEPQIIQRFAGTETNAGTEVALFEAAFIPVRLLVTPYAAWPSSAKEKTPVKFYDEFWKDHQSQAARGARECLPPVISDFGGPTIESLPAGSVDAIALAKGAPVAVVAKVIFEEPAWNVGHQRIATLKYLEVEKVIKNDSLVPVAAGDVVSLVADYGLAEVAGQIFCSLPQQRISKGPAEGKEITETKRFFVTGILPTYQPSHLMAAETGIFGVVNDLIYPPPGVPAFRSTPMPFSQLLAGLAED